MWLQTTSGGARLFMLPLPNAHWHLELFNPIHLAFIDDLQVHFLYKLKEKPDSVLKDLNSREGDQIC